MISLALVLLSRHNRISRMIWGLLITGSLLILYTFVEDYGWLIISNGLLSEYANLLHNADFLRVAGGFIPESYNWSLFWLGEVFLLAGIYCQYSRSCEGLFARKGAETQIRHKASH
jgi:hypothetical protein